MVAGNTYAAEGTLLGTSTGYTGRINSIDPLFFQPWTVPVSEYFAQGTTGRVWSGYASNNTILSPFTIDINLTGTQEA